MSVTHTPDRANAQFKNFTGNSYNDAENFASENANFPSAKFFGIPVQNEILNLIWMADGSLGAKVVNNTGVFVNSGTFVYLNGYSSANNAFTIGLADNRELRRMALLVTSGAMLQGQEGMAYGAATIEGHNTASAGHVGVPVYLSTSGNWTLTSPDPSSAIPQEVGKIVTKAASGTIQAYPASQFWHDGFILKHKGLPNASVSGNVLASQSVLFGHLNSAIISHLSGIPSLVGASSSVLANASVSGNIIAANSILFGHLNEQITNHLSGIPSLVGEGGSTSPGGSDPQVQFNDGGSFGGDAAFYFNKTANQLNVGGEINTSGIVSHGLVRTHFADMLVRNSAPNLDLNSNANGACSLRFYENSTLRTSDSYSATLNQRIFTNHTSDDWVWKASSTQRMLLQNGGNLALAGESPTEKLSVAGNINCSGIILHGNLNFGAGTSINGSQVVNLPNLHSDVTNHLSGIPSLVDTSLSNASVSGNIIAANSILFGHLNEQITNHLSGIPSLVGGSAAADTSNLARQYEFQLTFFALDNEPPSSNYATLDTRNSHPVLDFDDSTDESAVFRGIWPKNYNGSGLHCTIMFAATTATSATARWAVAFERIRDEAQDIDSDSFATACTDGIGTSAVGSGYVQYGTLGIANSGIDGLVGGEMFRMKVTRDADGTSGTDDMVGDAELVAIELRNCVN